MTRALHRQRPRYRLATAAGAALALALLPPGQAQDVVPSKVPMVLPSVLPPNVVLTLEDSTNMRRAFAPDSMFSVAPAKDAVPANTRRFKSAAFNPLYYNPNVKYVIPAKVAHSGVIAEYSQANVANVFSNAYINGVYRTNKDYKVNLATGYRPALEFDPAQDINHGNQKFANHASADFVDVSAGVQAYYYIYVEKAAPSCDQDNDACYQRVNVSSDSGPGDFDLNGDGVIDPADKDERLNFAIWYSFYRTRHLAMVSAAARVFDDQSLAGVRVAWQALNTCNSLQDSVVCAGFDAAGTEKKDVNNWLRKFDSTTQADLMSWLRRVPASGNVTLRTGMSRVGDYYRRDATTGTNPNNPYLAVPQEAYNSATNREYACRPNFHILMAGSAWDDTATNYCNGSTCGDKDGASLTFPISTVNGTTGYSPAVPYSDGTPANSNSLADIALHYWASDLRSTLANDKLLPYYVDRAGTLAQQDANPKNDPARWQHLVNYVVGVGLGRALGYNGPTTTPPANWGDTASSSGTGRLFDLWHAAVNSRGGFFGADTPEQIVDALIASLGRAAPLNKNPDNTINFSVGTALATNSTRLTTESALYQAQFRVDDWTGRLARIPVDSTGALQCTLDGTPACVEASSLIPSHSARNIVTSSGPLASGVAFNQSGLTAAGVWSLFGADDTARANVVNYLRGDKTNEGINPGKFRVRSAVLGDIVNSDIVFAGRENFGYQNLSPDNFDSNNLNTNSYAEFVLAKQSRKKMIYVGANDGMLHGFDAETMVEQFAYVPRSVLQDKTTDGRPALAQLADRTYNGSHRFFVDGSPWVGDACLKSPASNCTSSEWRTVLVGTTGAGGKGIFALDVSVPASFSAANVLWDYTGEGDADLGYTVGQPVIGRLHDGNYYAIFGNGYSSERGCPVLYLVNLATGAIRRLSATEGNLGSGNSVTECTSARTGLGRPSLFDFDKDRVTDAIYAADTLGRLWKFDVGNVDATKWDVFNRKGVDERVPLFTARNKCGGVQSITGLIEIGAPPKGQTGAMLYFGTGRFLSLGDEADQTRQTFYGILDRGTSTASLNDPGTPTSGETPCTAPPTTDSNGDKSDRKGLQEQVLGALDANDRRQIENGTNVSYTSNQKNLGWYIDLPLGGERMVTAPTLLGGRLVFPTLVPTADACDGGGFSMIVAVDPFSGKKTVVNIFDYANTGTINYDSFKLAVGVVKNVVAIDAGSRVYLFAGGSSSNVEVIQTRSVEQTGGAVRGRVSWREIVK